MPPDEPLPVDVSQLRSQYLALCRKLGTRRSLQTAARHDGSAHVELTPDGCFYVVTERGIELERRRAEDSDELLYWLMCDVVSRLAADFELAHRIQGQDSRRLLFQKEVELLARLNAAWAERRRAEIQRILAAHPYGDAAAD